jgi:hypothetical protein
MPIRASKIPIPEMMAAIRRGPVADTVLARPSIIVASAAYKTSAVMVAAGAMDSAW